MAFLQAFVLGHVIVERGKAVKAEVAHWAVQLWFVGVVVHEKKLLRMWRHILDDAGLALNSKVEPPIAVHTGLPAVFGRVVLLGTQAGMMEVPFQKRQLFVKCLPYRGRGGCGCAAAASVRTILIDANV